MSEIQYDPACVRCRIDAGKDVAGTTWQCCGHVHAERDALRLALETATRERDDARDEVARLQGRLDQFDAYGMPNVAAALDRIAEAERFMDEWRSKAEDAEAEREEARGGEAKWRRELDAAIELSERSREIVKDALNQPPEYFYDHHDNGNWSAEHIAHAIRCLFAERDALLSRPAPPADAATEAVREAKERLWDALDRESLGGTYLAARGLRAALSTPAPAPPAKEDTIEHPCGCYAPDGDVCWKHAAPSAKEGRT